LATFTNGKYYITDKGMKVAAEGGGEIERALKAQGFSNAQQLAALDQNYEGIVIEEGDRAIANLSLVHRSSLLRQAALKHFADRDGSIACAGCGFRAERQYGPSTLGLIEIHHTRPLFLTGKLQETIVVALDSVAPLCPNCHRVVHSDASKCMPIPELKLLVSSQLSTGSAY
jgi:predicted HNH restriction endonuclease